MSTSKARLPSLSTYLGHREPRSTYWYLSAAPELLALPPAARRPEGRSAMTLIAPTLQTFFTDRLARQLQASPRTIASYRDTLRLLLGFAHPHRQDTLTLDWDDLDTADHRLPGPPRDRSPQRPPDAQPPPDRDPVAVHARLTAPPRARRAHPRVLAIPPKRYDKRTCHFLTGPNRRA